MVFYKSQGRAPGVIRPEHVNKFFKSIGEKNVVSSKILRRAPEETEGAGASSSKQQA
jgi:hypothetical protein